MSEADRARQRERLAALLDDWAAQHHARSARLVAPTPEGAALVDGIADRLRGRLDVEVVRDARDAGEPPRAKRDLVAIVHPPADDWVELVKRAGKESARLVVVVARNRRPLVDGDLPESCATDALAPVLWSVGRVREHVYLDAGPPEILEHASARVRRRIARLHAFAVDVTPQTATKRRRLEMASGSGG